MQAGLPTSVGGNDAIGPRGDLDVMLSLRKQQGGISTPASPPTSLSHVSPLPSPVESRFSAQKTLSSSASTAAASIITTASQRSKTTSTASPPGSPPSVSSSNGAVSVLRGLFRVRSSSDAPSPPALQAEESFGTAGSSLLALEQQQQRRHDQHPKSPATSTSTSATTVPAYMHHHGSTPPLIGQRITDWPLSLDSNNDAARRSSVGTMDALGMSMGGAGTDMVRAQRALSVGASPLNPPPRRRSNTTSGAFSPASSIVEQPLGGAGVRRTMHQDGSANGHYQNGNDSIREVGTIPIEADEMHNAQHEKEGEVLEQEQEREQSEGAGPVGLPIPGIRSPSRNSFGVVGVGVSGSMSSSREPSTDRARAPSLHSVSTYASGSIEQQSHGATAMGSSPLDRSGSSKGRKRWSRQSGGILPKRLTPPIGPPPAVPVLRDNADNGNDDATISHNRGGSANTTPDGGDLASSWNGSSSMLAVNGNGTVHGHSGGSMARWSKRASASSAISFGSTWSSSQQQHVTSGGGGTLSRPGSSHRNSMPPPPRPAPTFAPPPIPTAPAAIATENGSGHPPPALVKPADSPPSLPPPTKPLSRSSERAHRLSFLAPKPPPTTSLPPRPDEPSASSAAPPSTTSKHHKRGSSASVSMPLYSIPASPEEPANLKPIPTNGMPALVSRSSTFVERLRRRSTPNPTGAGSVEHAQQTVSYSLPQERMGGGSPAVSPRNSSEAAAPLPASSASSGRVTPLAAPTATNAVSQLPSSGPAQYVLASPAHNHLFSSLSSHPHRSSAPASPIGQAITTQQHDLGFLNKLSNNNNTTPSPGRSSFFDDTLGGGNGTATNIGGVSPLPSASLFGNNGSPFDTAAVSAVFATVGGNISGDDTESMTSLSPPPRRWSRQLPAPPKGSKHSGERNSGSNRNSSSSNAQKQQQDSETESATKNNKLTIQSTGSVVSLGFVSL
jgi:hypothetical protein